MKPYFLSERELDDIASTRKTILFGAGVYGQKTLNMLKRKPDCFVDNDKAKQGTKYLGIKVKSPSYIKKFLENSSDGYVIICVEPYNELSDQIEQLGLQYGINCGITPFEKELELIDRLNNHEQRILFSNYDNNGGLYIYDFKNKKLDKVKSGAIRGFVYVNEYIYCCTKEGLLKLNSETYETENTLDINSFNSCGLTYDPNSNNLLIAATQTDEIIFVNLKSFKVSNRIKLSEKYEKFGGESHHINDIVIVNDYILASMFSRSGWWRFGIFDGGILEINIKTSKIKEIHTNNTWMPHSIKVHGDHIYILDSMNGYLIKDMDNVLAKFNGFLRGLEIKDNFCYIGQSQNRHISRLKHKTNISIDSGIYILDYENHISRFITLDNINNIYQIAVID